VENFPNNYKIVKDKISGYLHGEKKLYAFLASILFVVICIGFFSPTLLHGKKENWNSTLQNKINTIHNTSLSIFEEEQSALLSTAENLKKLSDENKYLSERTFQAILREEKFSKYQIFLLDSSKTELATTAVIGVEAKELLEAQFKTGTTYFHSSPLLTLLCYADKISLKRRSYFLLVTKIVETSYASQNISPADNFSSKLETAFESEVDVFYSPAKPKTLDGRYFSFDLPNNYGEKIGLITVAKPTLKAELRKIGENTNKVQSLFIIAGIIVLGFILLDEIKRFNRIVVKIVFLTLFLALFRWMLFALNFPASFLKGELTNPNYFSSAFAGGIVKSPLEFLVTAFFFSAIVFSLYSSNKVMQSFLSKKLLHPILRFGVGLTSLLLAILSIRGISAAVKSVVFDSSLRYFETADIIPGIPHLVMHIATFLVTLSGFVLIQLLLKMCYFSLPGRLPQWGKVIVLFLVVLLSAFFFVYAQKQPLIPAWLFSFGALLLLLFFFMDELSETKALKKFLFLAFASSLFTISLMNFFTTELEKEEVKRTALFLSRPQESYLNFLLNESLSTVVRQKKLTDFFLSTSTNYHALALDLWLQSSLREEKVSSSLALLDKRKRMLGYFSSGILSEQLIPQIAQATVTKDLQIFDVSDKAKQWQKILCGIIPIKERGEILGFAAATIVFTAKNALSVNPTAALFEQPELNLRTLNEKNFNVFLLAKEKIYPVSGTILPSAQDADKLFDFLSKEKEGWLNYRGASENLLGFGIERVNPGSHPFLIVAQKETAFSFSLFNFFKLFIVHTSFLLIVLLLLFVVQLKGKFRLTFRSQLLFAFLIIAILPIIALAVYNRSSVEEKNIALIHNSLRDKASLAVNYFTAQTINARPKNLNQLFKVSSENLLLSFSVFENAQLIFSTQQNLYDVSLLRKNISSLIQLNQAQAGNGFFIRHFVGSRELLSYFKYITLDNRVLFIEVNDYFNQIPVALNFAEVNVFLFGVYSFAIVLIVIVSSLLADQISSPIRKLTNATRAVAHGDLNVMLKENSMGELKELISGFNTMTEELRKNQNELAELEREQAWKEMAKQVAHEIKNPLTPMKLTLQQLVAMYRNKSKNFDALFEKVSETILAQIETLSQIASEFSSFAKMPSLKLAEIDLKKSLNEIILLFTDENISLHLSYSAQTKMIEADASQLKRMFINLTRNAIQANADTVSFAVDEDDKFLIIRISDNGKGIPEKIVHKIFGLDFTTKSSGMGLGLKLAKKFVESVNGDISVEATSSEGTTFLIRFIKKNLTSNATS